jgi:hypothetical protein
MLYQNFYMILSLVRNEVEGNTYMEMAATGQLREDVD